MHKMLVSLAISGVCVGIFSINSNKTDDDRNQKIITIFATVFALSYFIQTLLVDTSIGKNDNDSDIINMMENIQIGESPF